MYTKVKEHLKDEAMNPENKTVTPSPQVVLEKDCQSVSPERASGISRAKAFQRGMKLQKPKALTGYLPELAGLHRRVCLKHPGRSFPAIYQSIL